MRRKIKILRAPYIVQWEVTNPNFFNTKINLTTDLWFSSFLMNYSLQLECMLLFYRLVIYFNLFILIYSSGSVIYYLMHAYAMHA